MTDNRRRHVKALFVLVGLGVGGLPGRTLAQAWLPSRGEGMVTITYQGTSARGELDRYGEPYWVEGTTRAHTFTPEIEWGLSERVAMNVTLPFIVARYRGNHAHDFDHHGEPSSLDDGAYHGGTQDFRFGVRYGLKRGALAIAPFAEGVVPSRHYEYIGHSAIGDALWLFRAGLNVGGFLDRVTPGLYFHSQLSYTLAEELVGIRPNRSRLESEVGYFVTPRLAVRFLETLVSTHNGLLFPESRFAIPAFLFNHDPIKRRNFLNVGGGVSVAVSDSLGAFAAVVGTVWGENVHPVRGVTTGITWHFRANSSGVAPSRNSRRSLEALAQELK